MPRPLASAAVVATLASACAHTPAEPHAPVHGAHGASHGEREHHAPSEGMPHRFEDPQKWAARFDAVERDGWQKPNDVLAALRLGPADVVADIGCGTGYFTLPLARAVPQGRVYGVDVEPTMVAWTAGRAVGAGLTNVTGVVARADGFDVPERIDLALIVDTYHHIDGRGQWLAALKNKLKPGGRLAVIDFRKESPRGPPAAHKLDAGVVQRELAAAGWELKAAHDFLSDQYFLVFAPR